MARQRDDGTARPASLTSQLLKRRGQIVDISTSGEPGPKEGDEITVILILPDGSRLESTGIFRSASWDTDHIPVERFGRPTEYIPGETTLTLELGGVIATKTMIDG